MPVNRGRNVVMVNGHPSSQGTAAVATHVHERDVYRRLLPVMSCHYVTWLGIRSSCRFSGVGLGSLGAECSFSLILGMSPRSGASSDKADAGARARIT